MWPRVLRAVVVALLVAAPSAAVGGEDAIAWRDYSTGRLDYVAPTGPAWTQERSPTGAAFTAVERGFFGAPKRVRYLQVLRNTFTEAFADWTEREIADDFRDMEERGMQVMGVQTGMYSLLSLTRGEETRSGRTLYAMKMVKRGGQNQGWALERQELYLLFPRDHATALEFYVILIGDICVPSACREADLSVDALLPMLEPLRLRDG